MTDTTAPGHGVREALLPCPFCGINAFYEERPSEHLSRHLVECWGCEAMMTGPDKDALITAWNTRATIPPEPTAEPVAVEAAPFCTAEDVENAIQTVAAMVREAAGVTKPQPAEEAVREAMERAATIAECEFDNRSRMRSQNIDWEDGFHDGTQAAAAAIRAQASRTAGEEVGE